MDKVQEAWTFIFPFPCLSCRESKALGTLGRDPSVQKGGPSWSSGRCHGRARCWQQVLLYLLMSWEELTHKLGRKREKRNSRPSFCILWEHKRWRCGCQLHLRAPFCVAFYLNGFAVLCHRTGFALQPLSSPSALRLPRPPNTECLLSSSYPNAVPVFFFFNHPVSSHCFSFRFSPLVGISDFILCFGIAVGMLVPLSALLLTSEKYSTDVSCLHRQIYSK